MIITVVSITDAVTKTKGKGKPWYEFDVTYNSDKGVTQKRTFRSFSNDWDIAKSVEVGKTYDVKVEKENNFWVWKSATETDAASLTTSSSRKGGSTNWDDRLTFDKEKEPRIIRQAVLKITMDYFALHEEKPTPEEAIATAKIFEDWVHSKPEMTEMEVE